MGPNNWYISHWDGDVSHWDDAIGQAWLQYYGSPNNADSMNPPTNGWVALDDWVRPAPKLNLVAASNSANSEGAGGLS